MNPSQIHALLEAQRAYFLTGATLSVEFRLDNLRKLYRAVETHTDEIEAALRADLGKSDFEGFICETGLVKSEISHLLRHTRRWAGEHRVYTPLAQFPSRSYRKPSPYGNVLIMSPWNYPLLLTLDPLADAIAAGNTALIKPSAYAPATSALLERMLRETFPPEYVAVVTGGRQENTALLEEKFDLIFFTGSQAVGREVLRHAAEHLTPAVLELGGKSPCIVDRTANIPLAARRIVFGKYLNCGQTCVAPDYILCDRQIKDRLLEAIDREITRQYGERPLANPDYGRIISGKHFDRLCGLLDAGSSKIVRGGGRNRDTLQIEPTLMDGIGWEDAVMGEEIFGPILPVMSYDRMETIFPMLEAHPHPLALYLFSSDRRTIREVTARCRYGGGCINDTIIHLATSAMGFGGFGESGMGAYHGKVGFDAFSLDKSIVHKRTWLDLPMRYQPYNRKLYAPLLRLFLK